MLRSTGSGEAKAALVELTPFHTLAHRLNGVAPNSWMRRPNRPHTKP